MVSLPFFQSNLPCCPGEGDSHTRSDLEGPATQLNPALIQKSTPCVPRALLCRLYVRQHKANPRFSSAGNEIRYNGPNVFSVQQAVNSTDFQLSKREELDFLKSFQDLNYFFKESDIFLSSTIFSEFHDTFVRH